MASSNIIIALIAVPLIGLVTESNAHEKGTACYYNPCWNGGRCYNLDPTLCAGRTFYCHCSPGFAGEECKIDTRCENCPTAERYVLPDCVVPGYVYPMGYAPPSGHQSAQTNSTSDTSVMNNPDSGPKLTWWGRSAASTSGYSRGLLALTPILVAVTYYA